MAVDARLMEEIQLFPVIIQQPIRFSKRWTAGR